MSDRGFLFLFSVLMIAAGGGVTGWLLATGQAGSVDGLFLVLTALLIAGVFLLFLVFMLRQAMETPPAKPAAAPAKPAAAKAPAPAAQV